MYYWDTKELEGTAFREANMAAKQILYKVIHFKKSLDVLSAQNGF